MAASSRPKSFFDLPEEEQQTYTLTKFKEAVLRTMNESEYKNTEELIDDFKNNRRDDFFVRFYPIPPKEAIVSSVNQLNSACRPITNLVWFGNQTKIDHERRAEMKYNGNEVEILYTQILQIPNADSKHTAKFFKPEEENFSNADIFSLKQRQTVSLTWLKKKFDEGNFVYTPGNEHQLDFISTEINQEEWDKLEEAINYIKYEGIQFSVKYDRDPVTGILGDPTGLRLYGSPRDINSVSEKLKSILENYFKKDSQSQHDAKGVIKSASTKK